MHVFILFILVVLKPLGTIWLRISMFQWFIYLWLFSALDYLFYTFYIMISFSCILFTLSHSILGLRLLMDVWYYGSIIVTSPFISVLILKNTTFIILSFFGSYLQQISMNSPPPLPSNTHTRHRHHHHRHHLSVPPYKRTFSDPTLPFTNFSHSPDWPLIITQG